jgi:mannose-6-phosphate isomerase-like protein (cupin superfamily)
MPAYQSVDLDSVPPDGRAGPYQELMRRPGFSVGLYRLPAGGTDHQHPHAADEVYLVRSGAATLMVDGESVQVGPGSVVSVDRGVEHGFTDITEDLSIVVLFAPPEVPEE